MTATLPNRVYPGLFGQRNGSVVHVAATDSVLAEVLGDHRPEYRGFDNLWHCECSWVEPYGGIPEPNPYGIHLLDVLSGQWSPQNNKETNPMETNTAIRTINEVAFRLDGRVTAGSEAQAIERVLRGLQSLGFTEIGDGSWLLDRPSDGYDYDMTITDVTVGTPKEDSK